MAKFRTPAQKRSDILRAKIIATYDTIKDDEGSFWAKCMHIGEKHLVTERYARKVIIAHYGKPVNAKAKSDSGTCGDGAKR